MRGKASEKLEQLGQEYLSFLFNNTFNENSFSFNTKKNSETNKKLSLLNKKKYSIENNPCINNQNEDYYPELIPSFIILYATEMGQAKQFANLLHKECNEKLLLKVKLMNVSEIKDVKIFNENSLIVIIASTWGEGEPTDDCIEFNDMVKSKKFWSEFDNKENLNIAIFGLGNTRYTFYNAQGKLFYKIFIEENKINPLCKLGLGDAKQNIEKDFIEWKNNIFYKNLYFFYKNNYERNYEFYKKNNLLNEIDKIKEEAKKNSDISNKEKKEINDKLKV